MDEETKLRLVYMSDAKLFPNPCPRMETLGFVYEYKKGLQDKTDYYTRIEEDRIVYTNEYCCITFNLASCTMVLQLVEDNAEYYGGHPTMFLNNDVLGCISEIRNKLEWD